jgi:predicted dehydrogenase
MMIHDIDLLLALVASPVKQVEALGLSVLGGQEDIAHARVLFANGCLANLSVNRVSTTPQRRMQVWAPEGFAGIDFARRQLTLIQPSAEVREGRCDPRRLDAASLARLKTDLYGRHLQVLQRDCQAPADQLTQELEDFVHCVRTGQRPRVTGEDGREALALASRISESLQSHCWNGSEDGPRGPLDLPLPLGMLFHPVPEQAAA